MLRVRVDVLNDSLLKDYDYLIQSLPKLTFAAVNRIAEKYAPQILNALHQKPGPAAHPVMWKTETQKKAWYATIGFGRPEIRIIRNAKGRIIAFYYVRTDKMINGWDQPVVRRSTKEGAAEVVVSNAIWYSTFVVGENQQPFHQITGWYNTADVFDDIRAMMAEDADRVFWEIFTLAEQGYTQSSKGRASKSDPAAFSQLLESI